MAHSWSELDDLLKWNARRQPTLPSRRVFSLIVKGQPWHVDARRGNKRKGRGNQDLVATIVGPNGQQDAESLKQLIDDIATKVDASPDWMREAFLPALIRTVTFGDDPATVLPPPPRVALPGHPPLVLLVALQVIAITEHRKYGYREPFGGKYLLVRVCAGLIWGAWPMRVIGYGPLMQDTVASLRVHTGVREPPLGLVLAKSRSSTSFHLSPAQLEALSL